VATADWLLDHRELARAALEAVRDGRAGEVQVRDRLVDAGCVTPGPVAKLTTWGRVALNDLDRIDPRVPPAEQEQVEFLLTESGVGPGSRVLDVGCSSGRHLRELLPRDPDELVGVDVDLFSLVLGARTWDR
jgi:hypothetical protein